MEIKGENLIAATQAQVWEGLNDPEVLRRSIPGCESLEKTGDNQFKATVVTRIGPITARFNGQVELTDLDPPNGYTIVGSGAAGAMGGAKGKARVTLAPESDATRLTYLVDVDVSGRIAQLGGRLIQSTAGVLAGQFFNAFATAVGGPPVPAEVARPPTPAGVAAPVAGRSRVLLYAVIAILALVVLFYLLR